MEEIKRTQVMTDQELYQQYLKETGQGKPSEAELYAQYQQEIKQQPKSSALEAGISAFGTQASMGYLPQIQAALDTGI
jgi:hypothetical protein